MGKFKEEEWQNYLDNMVPGYTRKNSNKNANNSRKIHIKKRYSYRKKQYKK